MEVSRAQLLWRHGETYTAIQRRTPKQPNCADWRGGRGRGRTWQTARATALAEAEAVFIEAEAEAEAERVERMATVQGMASLYTGLNITQQRHKTSLDYLRMLRLHDGAKVSSTYLDRDNVLATVSKSQHA